MVFLISVYPIYDISVNAVEIKYEISLNVY